MSSRHESRGPIVGARPRRALKVNNGGDAWPCTALDRRANRTRGLVLCQCARATSACALHANRSPGAAIHSTPARPHNSICLIRMGTLEPANQHHCMLGCPDLFRLIAKYSSFGLQWTKTPKCKKYYIYIYHRRLVPIKVVGLAKQNSNF